MMYDINIYRSRGTPFDKCGAHSGSPQLWISFLPTTGDMYRLEKTQLIVRFKACFLRSSLLTVSGGPELNGYDNHPMNGLTTLVPLFPFQKKKKKSPSQLEDEPLISPKRYSDFKKLNCVTAWITRNCCDMARRSACAEHLTATELLDAEYHWLKTIQHEYYRTTLKR